MKKYILGGLRKLILKKNHWIKNMKILLLIVICSVLWGGSGIPVKADDGQKPNVFFVLIDDVGPGWIQPYAKHLSVEDVEHEITVAYQQKQNKYTVDVARHLEAAQNAMPFLDKLAAEGTIFNRCYTTASLCAPSRAGILTGCYQQKWGAYDNTDIDKHTGIPDDITCLAENFDEAGYNTAMIGKWHVGIKDQALKGTEAMQAEKRSNDWKANRLGYETSCAKGHHPYDRGFDYYFGYNSPGSRYYEADDLWEGRERVPRRPKGEFLTELFTDKVEDFVKASVDKNEPFFVYYAPMTLHGRIDPSPEKYSKQFNTGVPFTDTYAGHLLALDKGIESIFKVLEEGGQLNNTIFILCSDNGAPYGLPPYNAPYKGGKGTGWMGGSHTPLIMWYPKGIKKQFSNELVSTTDILPTALDFAGVEFDSAIDGRSLKNYLTGREEKGPRQELYSVGLHSTRWSHSYFGQRYKKDSDKCPLYTWRLDDENKVMLIISETPAGLYKEFPDGRPASVELFDLVIDVKQSQSILQSHQQPGQDFMQGLSDWLNDCKMPVENHQGDFKRLKELTSNNE